MGGIKQIRVVYVPSHVLSRTFLAILCILGGACCLMNNHNNIVMVLAFPSQTPFLRVTAARVTKAKAYGNILLGKSQRLPPHSRTATSCSPYSPLALRVSSKLSSSIVDDNMNDSSSTKSDSSIEVGDTKGAAILFEDVAISRGSNRILSNVNLRVERNNRWGIVGPNGVGKSTLLVSESGEFSVKV